MDRIIDIKEISLEENIIHLIYIDIFDYMIPIERL